MILIHPIVEAVTALLFYYVFYLGTIRFAANHFGMKLVFRWKSHVFYGKIAVFIMIAGGLGGLLAAKAMWNDYFLSGTHAWYGVGLCGILLGSYLTGLIMDSKKRKRKILPLIHALFGLAAFFICLYQLKTGILILNSYTSFKLF